jgi:hypothetical protein
MIKGVLVVFWFFNFVNCSVTLAVVVPSANSVDY